MKLKFDSELEHQRDAVAAAVGVFEGMNATNDDLGSIMQSFDTELFNDMALANSAGPLDFQQLLPNVQKIQEQNEVSKSGSLLEGYNSDYSFPNFTVEMETGTGKTYVYLRSIFEMNRQYGFRKFIIVVPSVAIREGTLKSLQITKEHFAALYNKVPYDYFVYDSKKNLPKVRQFATSNAIQIMVINIDAFRGAKDSRIFNQERESLSGRKPLDFVSATRPILIIDEPQSVDNTPASQKAIQTLNPLCAFRYSATHKNLYNLLYKLDPVRAYDMRLVKRIEVNSVTGEDNFNLPYIRLDKVDYDKGAKTPHAKVTIHVDGPAGPKTKTIKVKHGLDLASKSERPDYAEGFVISNISAEPDFEHIEFANSTVVQLGEELGGMGEEVIKEQIRDTIEIHLRREKRLQREGIKVLSLFFIDRVANYRTYDEDGNPEKGRFAEWFEELYTELTNRPLYKGILPYSAEDVHNGYFSQDKKGLKDTSGSTAADEDTYSLIMRDKERLLDSEEPLRFIFSHSALKEGWDNPNVFQICTLRDIGTDTERRQTIGRGLRLPVNQKGDRIFDENINRLTVIANERFEDYAKALQADIERDTGIEFGRVKIEAFSKLLSPETEKPIGQEESKKVWEELKKQGYVDAAGKIQDKFTPEQPGFVLDIADAFKPMRAAIIDEMKRYIFKNRIGNARQKKRVKYRKEVELNPDFVELWGRINKKTFYSVEYDTADLVDKAVEAIKGMAKIRPVQIARMRTEADITRAGVEAGKVLEETTREVAARIRIPDIMAFLQRETELTRSTLCEILLRSDRLDEFSINPQAFMTEVAKLLNETLHGMIIEGIKYERIGDQEYEMRLFEEQDERHLEVYLNRLYEVQNRDRTTHDYIPYDSEVEKEFAEKLDSMDGVRFFVKLPNWFKVPTPIGDYNPDWAIVAEKDSKVYLVRETKSTKDEGKRRTKENQKIECGEAHFKALDVDFAVCTNVKEAFEGIL
jgi:type III restriction enzyme